MASGPVREVTVYLRLETIGFIVGNAVSFVNVLFVVLERPCYIYMMVFLKTIVTIIGDLFFIPAFGVNGAAIFLMVGGRWKAWRKSHFEQEILFD